jgi:hypothetical protein
MPGSRPPTPRADATAPSSAGRCTTSPQHGRHTVTPALRHPGATPPTQHPNHEELTVTKQRLTRLVLAVSGLVGVLAAGGSSVHWN